MKGKVFIKTLFMICIFMLSTPAFALYWGVFDDYKQNIDNFAMVKFINNKPIEYHLTTAQKPIKPTDDPSQDLKNQLNQEIDYIDLIRTAFDTWPKDTKKFIKEAGRASEFKDIMPFLEKSFYLVQTPNEKTADLIVNFTSEEEKTEYCESSVSEGCYTKSTHKLVLIDPFVYPSTFEEDVNRPLAIFIHELGHFFGLTDQYDNLKNSDPEHATTDRFQYESSVMAASFKTDLYCDDVDAFINLVDITLAIKNGGQFTPRAKKGWASFCNGKKVPGRDQYYQDTFYKEGKILNKKETHDRLCKYSYDKNGKISQMLCPTPYNLYDKELSYNKDNIINKAFESDGEYTFIYHNREGNKIQISYMSSFADHLFESVQTEVDGKKIWTIFPGYNIYAFDAQGYVEIKDNQCKIHNFVPNTDFKAYDLTLVNGEADKNYGYTFLTDSVKPTPLYVKKQANSCVFKICDEKMLKKLGKTECVNLFQNDNITHFAAGYAGIDYQDLLDQTDRICKETMPANVINNAKALCKYFTEANTFFDDLKAQGRTLGLVPLFKKQKK